MAKRLSSDGYAVVILVQPGCCPTGPFNAILHLPMQVTVPQHRLTPLKNSWMSLYTPVTENMKLDMRMNVKAKKVVSLLVDTLQGITTAMQKG